MDKDDLISQHAFSLEIVSENIEDNKEGFCLDGKIPEHDEAPYNNMESKAFNKFLGVYVELTGDNKESRLLASVEEIKLDHDVKLIGTLNENPILNTAVLNVETPDGHKA